MAWKQTNEYGFNIVRYTIVRNDSILQQAEQRLLNQTPVKAQPLNAWENIVQNNDYAAIIAQALYGKDFNLSGGDEQGISKIINLSQELEQRFTISLYAADQNFEAACMAGWGWRDTEVKPDERYLYRIIPAVPEEKQIKIVMGAVFAAMDEYEELPKPMGLTAVFGDKSVMLTWDYGILSDIYNSYFIEKSTDGKQFKRLDGIPVTNLNNREEQLYKRMYFIDSLPNNLTKYYYRVKGITTFGETGPPSDSVAGKGIQLLPYIPNINSALLNDSGDLEIEWEFDERGNDLIKSFELNRSDNSEDGYVVEIKNIKPDKRRLLFDKNKLKSANYFTVTAVPFEGESRKSFPVLVQPVDSIPPSIPTGLQGKIDSAGIVTLSWNKNMEDDLLGYKIYRTFLKNGEAIPLFDIALRDTLYKDTVDVHSLNRKVYYTLSSVDLRYNQSDLSPVLELEKPDMIPPSSPVISGYRVGKDGIEIEWINSPDADVVQHRVWRREKGIGYMPAILLKSVTDSAVKNYIDTSAMTGIHYEYTVTAMKKNRMESSHSNGLTAFTNMPKRQNLEPDYFNAVVDKQNKMLKLMWGDKFQNVQYYELYKCANGENISLWKTIQSDKHEVVDNEISPNTTYQYIIRAILKDGKNTKNKTLKIRY
jgi:fibronectin type 3 domain-containing protein